MQITCWTVGQQPWGAIGADHPAAACTFCSDQSLQTTAILNGTKASLFLPLPAEDHQIKSHNINQ
jgi:hypothetical protein